jgi:hypothetical protein
VGTRHAISLLLSILVQLRFVNGLLNKMTLLSYRFKFVKEGREARK